MSYPRPSIPRSTGHSLIELCVCMAILSITLAFMLPHLADSRKRLATRAGALELAAGLRAARAEAIAKRITCAVRLYDGSVPGVSPSFHGYALFECSDKKGDRPTRWISGPHPLPAGARFASGGNQTFVFGATGTIVSRGINHKTIQIRSSDGQSSVWHDITVLTATGRVKVKTLQTGPERKEQSLSDLSDKRFSLYFTTRFRILPGT